jgi:diaminohydroxyphosphoribosylaminopyrimidine deaminase / 5-amino-6-(5-phosphoribosylamino)uracil reductase
VGAGTAVADDPDLQVRDLGARHQPVRVVMDTTLRTPPTGRLGQTAGQVPVWMLHADTATPAARAAWAQTGATLINVGALTARAALTALAARGITRVLCEGGATLAAHLMDDDLVDRLALFQAGLAIGAAGYPMIGPLNAQILANTPRLILETIQIVGTDSLSLWSRKTA